MVTPPPARKHGPTDAPDGLLPFLQAGMRKWVEKERKCLSRSFPEQRTQPCVLVVPFYWERGVNGSFCKDLKSSTL